jgi:NAD(P)-dependent dehydrogenase (short-subunit alcohol dehydrogenase family)
MDITGRKIVVTGASRGIGRATAEALARAGGRVALVARSAEVEVATAAIVAQGRQARGYLADLGKPADVDEMARRVIGDFGPPDIVVNNASAGRWLYVEETPAEEVVAMMAAPYFAAFYVTRAFLPAMLERGRGYLVNVNSPAALCHAWIERVAAARSARHRRAAARDGAWQGLQQLFRA